MVNISLFFAIGLNPIYGHRCLTNKSKDALKWRKRSTQPRMAGTLRCPKTKPVTDGGFEGVKQMDLLELGVFCVFYSGIVIYSLWLTVLSDYKEVSDNN